MRAFVFLGGLLLVAFVLSPWLWQIKLQYSLNQIESNIKDYQDVAGICAEISQLQTQASNMNNFRQMLETKKKDPRVIMNNIRKLLPAGATIMSFSLQADNSVQINITVAGPVDLAKLWVSFRDSGMFEGFDMCAVSLADQVQTLNLSLKLK